MPIELLTSDVTMEDLKELAAKEPQNDKAPKALYLKDIYLADQVFQPRQVQYNVLYSQEHLKDLTSALRSQGKALEALTVVPIGSKFFLIDGHHRLSAYKAAGWSKKVPVKVLKIDLERAMVLSIELNSKTKLPMTRTDKTEAAWKLTKAGTLSKKEIANVTGVTSLQGHMRRAVRELKGRGIDLDDMTWSQARKTLRGKASDFDRDAYINEKALALRDKLLKSAGTKLINNPEVLAEAIRMISGRLPAALVAEWHDEAMEYARDLQETMEADDLDI